MKDQHKVLNGSVKKLDDDLRAVKNKLNQVKTSEKKLNSVLQ